MKINRGDFFVNNDTINKQIPNLREKLNKLMKEETVLENGVTSNSVCEFKVSTINKIGENKIKVIVEILGEENSVNEIDLENEENLNKTFTMYQYFYYFHY